MRTKSSISEELMLWSIAERKPDMKAGQKLQKLEPWV
jgi:hypothetical protein